MDTGSDFCGIGGPGMDPWKIDSQGYLKFQTPHIVWLHRRLMGRVGIYGFVETLGKTNWPKKNSIMDAWLDFNQFT